MNHAVALSHPGRRRRKNEDAVLQHERADGDLLLVVADGVGGERAGEVASAEAVRVVRSEYGQAEESAPDVRLHRALMEANAAVWQKSHDSARYQGMSTTVVAAVVRGSQAWLANVGDSRGYIIEAGKLRQVTEDHSLVAERVREGELTEEEARQSRVRNVITRSVGSEEAVEVDVFGPIDLAQGTRLLLCSDGLTDVVEDADIEQALAGAPLQEAAQRLIDLANKGGGPDNISVVMYEAPEPSSSPRGGKKEAGGLILPGRYEIAGITTALVGIVAGALYISSAVGSGASAPATTVQEQPPRAFTVLLAATSQTNVPRAAAVQGVVLTPTVLAHDAWTSSEPATPEAPPESASAALSRPTQSAPVAMSPPTESVPAAMPPPITSTPEPTASPSATPTSTSTATPESTSTESANSAG